MPKLTERENVRSVRRRPRARDWRPKFLDALRNSGVVWAATRAAGIGRQTAYSARYKSRSFADAWDEAMEEFTDSIEAEVIRRGRLRSDYLLWQLLKSRRRQIYGEKVEVGGDASSPLVIEVVYTEEEPTRRWDEQSVLPIRPGINGTRLDNGHRTA
jgi:hypothetical protein